MGLRRLTSLATRMTLRRRTARRRLTLLYVAMFLVSAVLLLAITGTLAVHSSSSQISQSGASPGNVVPQSALNQANAQIQQLQNQLTHASNQAHTQAAHQLLVGSLIALAVMLVVSVLLGLFVARRVLRPLREMTDSTRRISADNLHERLAMPGPRDELKDLADTIDELLGRLEGSFAAQRRFVANASHELRTPLTTMRASLDVAVAKPDPVPPQTIVLADRIRTELDQVDRLLDGFLVLARAQHGVLPGRQTLAIDAIMSAALAARADAIAARNLVVRHTTGPVAAWVDGSQPLLTRMVDNVIDNAIGHNTEGGWIHVMTGSVQTGSVQTGVAMLVVETGGPVLDQQQVDQLAQPFRRLGPDQIGTDRTGSDKSAGLGLSIVSAIASAHGGALDLHARPEGGLRVTITLPTAPQPTGTGTGQPTGSIPV
jgi:signal transduction histidine kinase